MTKKLVFIALTVTIILCFAVPALTHGTPSVHNNLSIEDTIVQTVQKEIIAENGSAVTINIPVQFLNSFTEEQLQEFGSNPNLKDGDVINIENVVEAKKSIGSIQSDFTKCNRSISISCNENTQGQ